MTEDMSILKGKTVKFSPKKSTHLLVNTVLSNSSLWPSFISN